MRESALASTSATTPASATIPAAPPIPTPTHVSATRTGTSPPAAAAGPPPESTSASEAGRGTLFVLLAGIFITTLDFFIVNVAIPDTQAALHAGDSAMQWVVAGFGLALGSGLITAGRLGDMFGRRRLYVIGLCLFLLASLACGLAPNIGALLAGRVAQGVASAITLPQAMGIMNVVFTGARRTRAFTGYGLAMGLAAVFGQLIGGALIRADIAGIGWRSIYLINVPVCLAAVISARRIPEPHSTGCTDRTDSANLTDRTAQPAQPAPTRLDLPGVALDDVFQSPVSGRRRSVTG